MKRFLKLLFIAGWVFMMQPVDKKTDYKPLYPILKPNVKQVEIPTMKYNPFEDKWQYVEPDKDLHYNPFEDKWEWEE